MKVNIQSNNIQNVNNAEVINISEGVDSQKIGTSNDKPIRIFISYTTVNKDIKDKIISAIKALNNLKNLVVWSGSEILAGENWNQKIITEIKSAHIALFLVSTDFISSSYIKEVELFLSLELNAISNLIIIPIYFQEVPENLDILNKYQGLPKNKIPIDKFVNQDLAYNEIASEITKVILRLEQNS